ncbi:phytanoyl-CoA dioxygenase family protein [Pseudomonas sp. O230]|uniref:phytanoyl-CoA dioxygenase family protein n=1 Tax=Pseudomonas sp. O230 TaxID=3159450 RepID=UPI00387B01F7
MIRSDLPLAAYGVVEGFRTAASVNPAVEQLRAIGYAIIDSGNTQSEIIDIGDRFARISDQYITEHGRSTLESINEIDTIRAILTQGDETFLQIAMNAVLKSVIEELIVGKYILNQQNGITNPPRKQYSQSAWHRDLPYQHFVSSRPLALNALYCVDDFTTDNGSTFVLPASHKIEQFPSEDYIRRNAVQVVAKAGSFIILDCMLFHCGAYNNTLSPRRAINHLFTVPYIKQQINLPMAMVGKSLNDEQKAFLGFDYQIPPSVSSYISSRNSQKY